MKTAVRKNINVVASPVPGQQRTIQFIASTENPDRENDIIEIGAWDVSKYIGMPGSPQNPIFAWSHDLDRLPVGKTIAVSTDLQNRALLASVYFPTIKELSSDPDHPSDEALFADTVYNMYLNGMLNAVSVGFIGREYDIRDDDAVKGLELWERGTRYTDVELVEISACLIGVNSDALAINRAVKGFSPKGMKLVREAIMTQKAVIPYKKYPLAPEDQAWDGGKVVADSDVADLEIICTWKADKPADELVKGDFKLPHHMVKADEYKTVWKGVSAAMAAILGAHGGVDMSEDDRKKCYSHLSKHYAEFEKTVPEYKSYTEAELKAIMEEGDSMEEAKVKALVDEAMKPVIEQLKSLTVVKSGAKHSAETIKALQEAHDSISKGMDILKAMLSDSGTVGTSPGDDSGVERPKPNDGSEKMFEGIDLKAIDFEKLFPEVRA